MPYRLERLEDVPAVTLILNKSFSISRDVPPLVDELTALLDDASEPLYYISDARQLQVNFADMVGGLALITRGQTAFLRHPNIRQILIVATSELIRLGSNALKQVQYGELSVETFDTVEDAVAYVRERTQ